MSKLDTKLRVITILVESSGGSIEPVQHLLRKNPTEITAEDDRLILGELWHTMFSGFFHCAAENIVFTDISRIEESYGHTLEEAYPGVSPTFMKLARTFWTFKVILNESKEATFVCDSLLQEIEVDFAGLFFPTPDWLGMSPPKEVREQTMRKFIEESGADLDVEDYIRGNYYLR